MDLWKLRVLALAVLTIATCLVSASARAVEGEVRILQTEPVDLDSVRMTLLNDSDTAVNTYGINMHLLASDGKRESLTAAPSTW